MTTTIQSQLAHPQYLALQQFAQACAIAPDFIHVLDDMGPWDCSRADLAGLVLEAPNDYLQGWLLAVLDCRHGWAMAHGETGAQDALDARCVGLLGDARDRLAKKLESHPEWADQFEGTDVLTASRGEVEELFCSASEPAWQGYLAAAIEFHCMTRH